MKHMPYEGDIDNFINPASELSADKQWVKYWKEFKEANKDSIYQTFHHDVAKDKDVIEDKEDSNERVAELC